MKANSTNTSIGANVNTTNETLLTWETVGLSDVVADFLLKEADIALK